VKLAISERNQQVLEGVVAELVAKEIASRIGEKDDSIWGPAAQPEASIRLGWVESARTSSDLVPDIIKLRDEFRASGIDRFVLCGMGGSSLAPEVITKTSKVDLVVLDSTAPDQVGAALVAAELEAAK
jgi:glucose-6-phosphate isomerase